MAWSPHSAGSSESSRPSIPTEIGGGQRGEAHLGVPGGTQPRADQAAHLLGRPLAHRAGDHPRLAEAAAAGTAAEHLHRQAVVHDLGERGERPFRVGPLAEIGNGALVHHRRYVGITRGHRHQRRAVVLDVVQRRHVHPGDVRQGTQHRLAAARCAPGGLPLAHHGGDLGDHLLALAEHGQVDEVGQRLGIERGVPTHHHQRMLGAAGRRRATGTSARSIMFSTLVYTSSADRLKASRSKSPAARWVSTENSGTPLSAHQRFQVVPGRVGSLGDRVVAFVEDFVEDLQPLVGQANFVRVGVGEQPGHLPRAIPGSRGAVLAPDVAGRLCTRARSGSTRAQREFMFPTSLLHLTADSPDLPHPTM